jgi:hypothetical protein
VLTVLFCSWGLEKGSFLIQLMKAAKWAQSADLASQLPSSSYARKSFHPLTGANAAGALNDGAWGEESSTQI